MSEREAHQWAFVCVCVRVLFWAAKIWRTARRWGNCWSIFSLIWRIFRWRRNGDTRVSRRAPRKPLSRKEHRSHYFFCLSIYSVTYRIIPVHLCRRITVPTLRMPYRIVFPGYPKLFSLSGPIPSLFNNRHFLLNPYLQIVLSLAACV